MYLGPEHHRKLVSSSTEKGLTLSDSRKQFLQVMLLNFKASCNIGTNICPKILLSNLKRFIFCKINLIIWSFFYLIPINCKILFGMFLIGYKRFLILFVQSNVMISPKYICKVVRLHSVKTRIMRPSALTS